MDLILLKETLEKIEQLLKEKQLLLHYKNLANSLYQLANNKSDTLLQKVEIEKNQIIKIHDEFTQEHWTETQIEFIKKFNRDRLLGRKAIRRIILVFRYHNANPFEEAREVEQIVEDYNLLMIELNTLLKSLQTILIDTDTENEHQQTNSYNLLFLSFEEGTFFQNINLLEKFCRIWNRILMSFMYLTGETIKPTLIYDIKPKSISFALEPEAIKALTTSACKVLAGYKKVLEIRKLQLEVNTLNLHNKYELENLLEDEVINIVDILSFQVSTKLVESYDLRKKIKKEEIRKNIQIALKQIVNFIEKGGKIESTHSRELHELIEKIIILLKSIKDIETKTNYEKEFHFDLSFEEQEEEKF